MEDDDDPLWQIEGILSHKITRQGRPKLLIKWTNGDQNTWEYLSTIKQDDPIVCTEYIYMNYKSISAWLLFLMIQLYLVDNRQCKQSFVTRSHIKSHLLRAIYL